MIEDLLHYKTDIKMASGKLLISEPMLQDKTFQKSVIYICHHDANESIGYVLNQKAELNLGSIMTDLNGIYFPLYVGGPVGLDSLHLIHSMPELIGGEFVYDDIYWGGDLESAIENIKLGRINESNCKFFIGYSGWSEGQLDAELDMNSWLVANSSKTLLFETKDDLLFREKI
jgi:putative transcriptional regulator